MHSAQLAAGLGGDVTLLDVNLDRLRDLSYKLPANVRYRFSNHRNIAEDLRVADLVIGGVYLRGARAPQLVSREDLRLMKPRSVVVTVCVDQGGCFEATRPTTHEQAAFVEEGVVHYCVADMPGAVPRTSTFALANATLPYLRRIAGDGWEQECAADGGLLNGVNIHDGMVLQNGVAAAWDLPLHDAESVL